MIQAERYFRNEDTSHISFKQFNKRPQDKYPEITFCFGNGSQFKDVVKQFQVSKSEFSTILKGDTNFSTISPKAFKMITQMHPDVYFKDFIDILQSYTFKTNKEIIKFDKESQINGVHESNSYFILTHRDSEQFCFTRTANVNIEKKNLRKEDQIVIEKETLMSKENKGNTPRMKVFLHYPGQFIRNIESPVIDIFLKDSSEKITLTISDVTTLRKRSTSAVPCNDSIRDETYVFRMKVIDLVKCKPMFWYSLIDSDHGLPMCETSDELKEIDEISSNSSDTISESLEPCTEMRIPVDTQRDDILGTSHKSAHLLVSILYLTTEYQEIVNLRDFDFDSMFSGIGGFVGMFLGCSLLQLVDMIEMKKLKEILIKTRGTKGE